MSQVSLKKIEAEKEFAQIHRGKGCENEAETAVTGHKPRNATAIGAGREQGRCPLEPSQGTRPWQHLDFGPMTWVLDSWPPDCETINFRCFKPPRV